MQINCLKAKSALQGIAPVGDFAFSLLVVSQILRQTFDDGLHLELALLGLVLLFSGQQGILNHSELPCAHQMVFIKDFVVDAQLHLLNFG